jgi:hypothetical protein
MLVSVSQPLATLPSQLRQSPVQLMLQAPVVQDGVPLAALQTLSHVPQWEMLEFVLVSQPSEYELLQSSHGAVQDEIAHVTPEQTAVPLFAVHPFPHAPQCRALSMSDVSQPLLAFPSQLPQSSSQVIPQVPAVQKGAPFVSSQALVQAPQFEEFVSVFTSQPSPGSSLQSA